ncbi:hypothetical protein SLA2020_257670 [Shorea laevis]
MGEIGLREVVTIPEFSSCRTGPGGGRSRRQFLQGTHEINPKLKEQEEIRVTQVKLRLKDDFLAALTKRSRNLTPTSHESRTAREEDAE